jgi:hypothetical protein
MKHYLLLSFLSLLICSLSYAGCDDSIVVSISTPVTGSSTYKHVRIFDKDGNLTSKSNYQLQGNIWEYSSREEWQWDSAGHMIKYLYQSGNNFTWEDQTRQIYVFNSHGDLDSTIIQTAGWNDVHYEINRYDASFHLIEFATFDWDGTTWTNQRRILHYYDSNGDDTLEHRFNGSGISWIDDQKILKYYDANHNLIESAVQVFDGIGWSVYSEEFLHYTNNLNDSVTTIIYGGASPDQFLNVIIFDSLGRWLSKNQYTWDGSNWNFQMLRDSIAYNAEGKIIYSNDYVNLESYYANYDVTGSLIEEGGVSVSSPYSRQYTYSNGILSTIHHWSSTQGGIVSESNESFYYAEIFGSQIKCTGQTVILTADTCSTYTYLWSTGATTPSINAGASSYSVTVTHPNGMSYTSYFFEVIQFTSPIISLGNDTILCLNQSLNLSPGPGFDSYIWNDSSSAITFTAQSSVADTIVYSVTVGDGNGCQTTDSVTVYFDICSEIKDFSNSEVNLFPNPVSENLTVILNDPGKVKIEIINAEGKILKKFFFMNSDSYQIQLKDLANGFYILRISNQRFNKTHSFIKQ